MKGSTAIRKHQSHLKLLLDELEVLSNEIIEKQSVFHQKVIEVKSLKSELKLLYQKRQIDQ